MQSQTGRASPRLPMAAALVAAVFALAAAALSAYEQAMTVDEPDHLAYSRRLLVEGESSRSGRLHFDSKTPVVLVNVVARRLARDWLGVEDPRALRFAARLPTVGWFALLIALGALVAGRIAGPAAASLAAIAVALDPNLIAHASLATVDVAYALATLAAAAAAWRFAASPGLAWGATLGLALAFAFACKFSAPLLLPCVAFAVVRALHARGGPGFSSRRAVATGVLALAVVFCAATCASYLFLEVFRPLGELELRSRTLGGLARALPSLRLPLPAGLLTGLDTVMAREATKDFPVMVLGRHYPRGVFFYFAVGWAFKTPLALIAFQLAGAAAFVRERALVRAGEPLFYLLNLVLALVFFSFFLSNQVGYRYVLMCLPLAAVLAAAALARRLGARRAGLLAPGLLVLAAAGQVPYLGNHLAFTNALVQPKRQAFQYVSDLDWGQNDDKLEGFLRATGRVGTPLNPPNPLPGENVYQVIALAGPRHDWVRRNLQPVEHFRHSFLMFRVTAEDFRRYLADERRFEPDTRSAAACEGQPRHPPADAERVVTEHEAPTALVCFEALRPLEVVLESEDGMALFGPLQRRRKLWDVVSPGQEAHLLLEPGLHAFGVDRGFTFRGRLRAPADGLLWSVTRGPLPAAPANDDGASPTG